MKYFVQGRICWNEFNTMEEAVEYCLFNGLDIEYIEEGMYDD